MFDRIKQLEILPKTKIENDREIWDKWIEAQDLLLKRNALPFKVKKYHQPIEVKNDSGTTTRYKFKVDLFVEESSEYKEIEDELLNEFSINETFDDEGNIFLKFDDIYRGLDLVINKKFKEKIEREKGIAAILKIRPLNIAERVQQYFTKANFKLFSFDEKLVVKDKTYNRVVVTSIDVPRHILISYLLSQNYELKEFKGEFKVINNGSDITANLS